MDVYCQCKFVHFKTPTTAPLAVYICHCLECRAQSASAFGCSATFPRFEPPTTDPPLGHFSRRTDTGNTLDCYFCPRCGTRLLHIVRDENSRTVSVKGGCIAGLKWDQAQHIYCKRAVVPIPNGVTCWDGEPPTPNED